MAVLVQVLGWLAFLAGGIGIFYGATNEYGMTSSPSMIAYGVGVLLILNGAMLCVFGEIGVDIRKMREVAER